VQRVNCREDVAAKREILGTLEHHRSEPAASPAVAVGRVGGRPTGGVGKDTSGQVTINVRVSHRVVGPKGATT